jgi:hypothetical protein
MLCEVLPLGELVRRPDDCVEVLTLTRQGSDFRLRLQELIRGHSFATEDDGHIAIVWSGETLAGWSRTSKWQEGCDGEYPTAWDTLEAYVRSEWRDRGIASLASSALVSSILYDEGMAVAVFSPAMMMVAKRCGMHPTMFIQSEDGEWRRA